MTLIDMKDIKNDKSQEFNYPSDDFVLSFEIATMLYQNGFVQKDNVKWIASEVEKVINQHNQMK